MQESQDDDFDVWLVRKPTKVTLKKISNITFPKKARSSSKLIEMSGRLTKKSSGVTDQLDCGFERLRVQVSYIHSRNANNTKNLRNLEPYAKIRGVLWINYVKS
uniref:Uncharacterized protein n=1 Tax=Ditylenchus dipsaci TaxID=166011 RepID=A0A915DSV9_9BILA